VATLEQLLDAHQLAHAHPSGSSADIIAGQILPFAPEPLGGCPAYDPQRRLPSTLRRRCESQLTGINDFIAGFDGATSGRAGATLVDSQEFRPR
jgi:hypothetical protein